MFSRSELERYSRHLVIPEFNIEGQRKLKHAKVLVVGVGGLGAPLLLYLGAAGVGTLGLVDFDKVDISNLQRQVLFQVNDIGEAKVEVAARRLKALNPHVQVEVHNTKLTSENVLTIIEPYDVVVDGTDNFPARYLINDACLILDKPEVYGAVFRFDGQVSVFNYKDIQGNRGPNYRDLFPEPPPLGSIPNCAEGGVLGVLPGIIGSIQASEVIKIISGIGNPLSGRLLLFDALNFETRIIKFDADSMNIPITQLSDYEHFCSSSNDVEVQETVKEISPQSLHEFIQSEADIQLVDVREPYEYEIVHLNGELIPLIDIDREMHKISSNKQVIMYCRSGYRSRQAIRKLEKEYGFTNLYNLRGGLLAWIETIDNTLPTY